MIKVIALINNIIFIMHSISLSIKGERWQTASMTNSKLVIVYDAFFNVIVDFINIFKNTGLLKRNKIEILLIDYSLHSTIWQIQ